MKILFKEIERERERERGHTYTHTQRYKENRSSNTNPYMYTRKCSFQRKQLEHHSHLIPQNTKRTKATAASSNPHLKTNKQTRQNNAKNSLKNPHKSSFFQ